MKRFVLFVIVALLVHHVSAAVPYNLKGRVIDPEGEPCIGAAIQIKGTTGIGVVADVNGYFTISVSEKDVLVVSMISYETKEVPVGGRKNVVVELKEAAEFLEAAVMVGYGEQSAKDVTGSVTSMNMSAIEKMPSSDLNVALQGRMAGVVLSSNDGQPGEEMNLVIRGANSVTQSNAPLYVIDGFPTEDFSMQDLNPNDVKSISILKDASAGAIYGSRGANGVVIIETKNGKGKCNVSYNGYVSVNEVARRYDVMDPYEYVRYVNELSPESGKNYLENKGMTLDDYKSVKGYDWQSQIFRLAITNNHSISVQGGTEQTQYLVSGSYLGQEGVILETGQDNFQGRIKLSQKLHPKLELNVNANYSYSKLMGAIASEQGSSSSSWQSYLMYRIWSFTPLEKGVMDSDEGDEEEIDVNRLNPVTSAVNSYRKVVRKNFMGNVGLKWQILPSLRLTSTFGVNSNDIQTKRFNNSKTYSGFPTKLNTNGVNGSYETDGRMEWVNENTLNYKKKFNRNHTLNALAGFTISSLSRDRYSYNVIQIPNENLGISGLESGTPNKLRSTEYESRTMSWLARVNYSLKSRYLFTASVRADGSSKFPADNRWGIFPSAAFAWRMKEENFLRNVDVISDFKFRFSWGITGNNRVGDYAYFTAIDYSDHFAHGNQTPSSATGVSQYNNNGLSWEKTEQINIGLDYGMFDNRVMLTADVYRKTTRDLLLNAYVPYSTGVGSALLNVGSVRNDGVEITLETLNVQGRDFKWSSSFNISFNRNEVLELANNQTAFTTSLKWTGDFSSTPLYITRVGGPISSFYGLVWDGVYQLEDFNVNPDGSYSLKTTVPDNGNAREIIQPGDIKYVDQNGDGTINNNDMTMIGRAYPIHTGGFSNDFTYKGFTLSIFLQWSYGNDIMNANRIALEGNYAGRAVNQLASYADRWSLDNQTSTNYRAGGYGPRGYYSTRTLEDGSYLRIKNVMFAYDLPKKALKKMHMSKMQIFASLQNLYTFTNYSGLDPEVSTLHSALTPGFDYSAYPRARVYQIGLKLGF